MRAVGGRTRACAGLAALVTALGLLVPATAASGAPASAAKCPLSALKSAKKPVDITFWHSMTRANEDELTKLTDQFNGSQSDVHVTLVNQTSYKDTFEKYVAGLSTGDLPDLVQIQDISLGQMIDTGSVLPAQACVKADHYDLSDHLKRVTDYYTVKGTLWPMPFNVSNPVFYYDRNAFTKAGLDPDKPPTTLDEVKADAKKLKDAGAVSKAGYGLKTDPWYLEQWLSKAGKPYVNNGNGRSARATKVAFDNSTGNEIFSWMSDMVSSGLAEVNNNQGNGEFDNLIGIGTGSHAMTIDSSGSLGTITQVLSSGQYPGVELGVSPMPGPTGKGGVLVGGAALYMSNKSAPEKQAAAWEFSKFLNEAQSQADWAAATGYVPVRKSAVDLPAVKDLWSRLPGYKVAYDQLLTGVNNSATAGPVIGDYQGVRDIVVEAEQSMFSNGTKPKAALKTAATSANQAIDAYNSRVGG